MSAILTRNVVIQYKFFNPYMMHFYPQTTYINFRQTLFYIGWPLKYLRETEEYNLSLS